MLKFLKSSFLIIGIVGIFMMGCESFSCGSGPEALMEKMEKLIAEVEKKDFPPKSTEWEKYDDRFRYYYEECYDRWESEMKGREKRKFAGMVSRYIALRYGRSFFKNLFDGEKEEEPENIPDLLKNFLKGDIRL